MGLSPSTFSSPVKRATITAPQESLDIFTEVRHISSMRSTARIRPIASTGKPTAARMMAMATKLVEGIAVTHSYKAVPHVDRGTKRQHKAAGAVGNTGIFSMHSIVSGMRGNR